MISKTKRDLNTTDFNKNIVMMIDNCNIRQRPLVLQLEPGRFLKHPSEPGEEIRPIKQLCKRRTRSVQSRKNNAML